MSTESKSEQTLPDQIDSLKASINKLHQVWADNIAKAYWDRNHAEINRILEAMREPLQ